MEEYFKQPFHWKEVSASAAADEEENATADKSNAAVDEGNAAADDHTSATDEEISPTNADKNFLRHQIHLLYQPSILKQHQHILLLRIGYNHQQQTILLLILCMVHIKLYQWNGKEDSKQVPGGDVAEFSGTRGFDFLLSDDTIVRFKDIDEVMMMEDTFLIKIYDKKDNIFVVQNERGTFLVILVVNFLIKKRSVVAWSSEDEENFIKHEEDTVIGLKIDTAFFMHEAIYNIPWREDEASGPKNKEKLIMTNEEPLAPESETATYVNEASPKASNRDKRKKSMT
ncbi:hypothetical protein L1987_03471 [Smallanthus sonchifolius]|uniref:Uncharacterized protein n=1 Tax=Smallanthus sonchifolius TaxID=185202 RepID=A0ACB9KAN6_9ASTR|nr:hypothetical protein L1987_03471 [Smallanthus sonchifolius]